MAGVHARYQVHFFHGGDARASWSTQVFDVSDATVLEVIHWAQEKGRLDQALHAVALAQWEPPELRLTWIVGMDLNGVAVNDAEARQRDEMLNPTYVVEPRRHD